MDKYLVHTLHPQAEEMTGPSIPCSRVHCIDAGMAHRPPTKLRVGISRAGGSPQILTAPYFPAGFRRRRPNPASMPSPASSVTADPGSGTAVTVTVRSFPSPPL